MSANTQLWLDLANQLMLAFALVFLAGMVIGIIIGCCKKKPKREDAPLPAGPVPTEQEMEELCRFYERSQTWPRRERK